MPSIQSVRNQRIAYYAKIPEAVIAQSVYTKNKNYNITKVSANDIWDNLKKGDKIKQIFKLQDWIMGGGYYHGKHIFRLTNNNLLDKYAKEILTEYNIRYIIDSDIAKTKFKFFESIQPIKNKIYTNPHIDIYDLEKGKQ